MPHKRIDVRACDDGSVVVTTPDEGQPWFAESRAREDAEVQAALDALRAAGVARPVLFQVGGDDPASRAAWRLVLPELRRHGTAVWNAQQLGEDDGHHYVLRPDRARELLRDVLKFRGAS